MSDTQKQSPKTDGRGQKSNLHKLRYFLREFLISFIWAVMIGMIMMANGIYTQAVDFVYANF